MKSFTKPAVLLLFSTLLLAQQAPEQTEASTPAPTFKSRSDFVLVPVVVRDHKGRHLEGLSKDSFRLEENGKEQAISWFEELHGPRIDPTSPQAVDRGYSNLPFDDLNELRLTIIVFDLLNTTLLQRTDGKDQIGRFLSKHLVPNQPVSLLCLTPHGLRLVHPFSTDKRSLAEALAKTPVTPATAIPRWDVVLGTIRQMREIATAYAGIPGRKTMILAGANIPELMTEQQILESSPYANEMRQTWRSLIDANISVYPIQLMSWASDPTRRGLRSRPNDIMLRSFAASTGGNMCMEANDLFGCLGEAVDDSRSYYMLGFSVQSDDHKPGWRDLNVKVATDHVDIRARSGFYYEEPTGPKGKSAREDEIRALASSLAYSAVPMYVKVLGPVPTSNAGEGASGEKKSAMAFLLTIPVNSLKIDPASANPLDLEVGAIALTRDSREAAEELHSVHRKPTPEDLRTWTKDGIRLEERLDLPAGSYDIRFLARDNNAGQIGTVVFPLDVK